MKILLTVVIGAALLLSIIVLGIYMPMFGLTLILVRVLEVAVLRRIDGISRWLGLAPGRPAAA